jgi:hypothetical protein
LCWSCETLGRMTTEQNILELVTIQYQALDSRLDTLQASIDALETRLKTQEAAFNWYLERLAEMNPMFRVYHTAFKKKD